MKLQLLAHSYTKGAEGTSGEVIEVADEATAKYLLDNGAAREVTSDKPADEIVTPAAASGNSPKKSADKPKAPKAE